MFKLSNVAYIFFSNLGNLVDYNKELNKHIMFTLLHSPLIRGFAMRVFKAKMNVIVAMRITVTTAGCVQTSVTSPVRGTNQRSAAVATVI